MDERTDMEVLGELERISRHDGEIRRILGTVPALTLLQVIAGTRKVLAADRRSADLRVSS